MIRQARRCRSCKVVVGYMQRRSPRALFSDWLPNARWSGLASRGYLCLDCERDEPNNQDQPEDIERHQDGEAF